MIRSRLQTQRSELKYIVPESQAARVRTFVRSRLELDAFGAQQPDLSYPVHSLYLDSPEMALHQSTINGERNRYKLRIRFYENRPEAPVYFEIKRRRDEAIFKERTPVPREAVEAVVSGRIPPRELLALANPAHERALFNFCRHVNELRARPVAHVAYQREAWLSRGHNRLRVTFDRNVRSSLEPNTRLDPELVNPVSTFGKGVVLELKFTGEFPAWMREMVQACGLRQCSAAKYVDGILRMEERRLLAPVSLRPPAASQRRLRLASLARAAAF